MRKLQGTPEAQAKADAVIAKANANEGGSSYGITLSVDDTDPQYPIPVFGVWEGEECVFATHLSPEALVNLARGFTELQVDMATHYGQMSMNTEVLQKLFAPRQ